MRLFHNDYNEICHPEILKRLQERSSEQMPGYGEDAACNRAADLIRSACGNANLAVHFLVGGTQTNLIVIAASLRPHQGVISADSGHVNVHETGAIEATGHKVILLPGKEGKINSQQVRKLVEAQSLSMDAEHIVQPKMVYISNPTEYGTTYSLQELTDLSECCRALGLILYVDGARMGYGLAAADNDITLADYARLCDAFYIGGTKVGTMFGEAVVISNPSVAEDFRYLMKQRGGLLSKGWLLGLQFERMFEDGLYLQISKHADLMADQLRDTLRELSLPLYLPNRTNQVFVTLPNRELALLGEDFTYAVWEEADANHTIVRFCTSWATTQENVDALCQRLRELFS